MRFASQIFAVLFAGLLLGLFATWMTVVRPALPKSVADGPWRTNLAVGDTQSDPYTRANVAIHGLFALKRSETIYYTATADADGDAFDGRCSYRIVGRDPDARWWSITAYGDDDFLIPNSAHRYSVAQTTVARKPDGSFAVQVGGTDAGANWIPAAQGHFSLTLRLYNPGPGAALDPEDATLPSLKKVSCS